MADRTHYAPDSLDFNQCDTPRGMEFYNFDILTEYQQGCLNRHKTEAMRDNQKYLYKNPEIRAVVQLIIRKLLLERPSHDLVNFVGRYFRENWQQITEEVKSYVEALPGKPEPIPMKAVVKDEKHVTLDDARIDASSIQLSISSDENFASVIIREILDEMIEKTHDQYQKKVRTSGSIEIIEDKKDVTKSYEDDDELSFDLGLDFDLDFSTYHEEDDKF